ncbi:MAG: HD domain-containing protein [Planctomycetia bacterium]|nr:HD domain-containing protein [Planctomycetia bacterium]
MAGENTTKKMANIIPLSQMVNGTDADCFVIMAGKEELVTKEGKRYLRVIFRDLKREAQCLLWNDSIFYKEAREKWMVGHFYKIRVLFRDTGYGPKLELRRIRETTPADGFDGFDPDLCRPSSRIRPDIIIEDILSLARTHLGPGSLLELVQRIFKENRLALQNTAASRIHHHAYQGGLLEHTLSVARIALGLVEHYQSYYPNQKRLVSKPLVVAGAILHDVGKIREMTSSPIMPGHTQEGELVGHAILGRDIVREAGPQVNLDRKTQLLLEHIILSHSRFPDWGAPKLPMSLEALIVHQADYAEATYASALRAVEQEEPPRDDGFTRRNGPFGTPFLAPRETQPAPPGPKRH